MEVAEAHQYAALSCFTILTYKFNSISCTHELWKIRLLKTKRKCKMTNPRLQDPSAKTFKTPRSENLKKTRLRDRSQTLPRWNPIFPKTHIFEVPLSSQPHIEMLPKMNLDTAYAENRCGVNVSTFRISRRTDWSHFFNKIEDLLPIFSSGK